MKWADFLHPSVAFEVLENLKMESQKRYRQLLSEAYHFGNDETGRWPIFWVLRRLCVRSYRLVLHGCIAFVAVSCGRATNI